MSRALSAVGGRSGDWRGSGPEVLLVRTENVNGRWLLCGAILPGDSISNGQLWAAASGADHTVRVSGFRDGWVGYTWEERGARKYHEKEAFAFQCRYCLVLDGPTIPEELARRIQGSSEEQQAHQRPRVR